MCPATTLTELGGRKPDPSIWYTVILGPNLLLPLRLARAGGIGRSAALSEEWKTIALLDLFGDDAGTISRVQSIEMVLRVLRRVTGLRVVLVARVTDTSWTACAVLDDAGFGLKPGDELALSHTY